MIPGITAADEGSPPPLPSGPGPYAPGGVQFNSCRLTRASITCTNNGFLGFAGWFKNLWETGSFGTVFMIDPSSNFNAGYINTTLEFASGNDTSHAAGIDLFAEPPLAENVWQHIMGAIDTNHGTGSKIIKLYVNDVDVGPGASGINYFDNTTGSFDALWNGKPLYVGSDGSQNYPGIMADLSIWPGINLLTSGAITTTTRRYFISATGRPVAPSVAVAALGAPVAFLTGNAAAFPGNSLGTAGAFTVAAGSLSNVAGP